MLLYILFAVFAGFITTISNVLNSALAKKIGIIPGILVNFLVGITGATAVCIFNINKIDFSSVQNNIPLYLWVGGSIGFLIVMLTNFVMPKIPTVYVVILVFTGQIVSGTIIDYFFFDKFSIHRIEGIALIIVGLLFNTYVDKSTSIKQKDIVADVQNDL